ncbi:hypothetical protein Q5P01_023651 [Channa striata]|uniref:Uncharacterized protein n=1 Tax=Channa striata TaxID=64152 RepID=A0AA88IWR0_CHASR|nr:hypothetical protein Q5P01_023651 [Channa striata]
MQIYNHLTPYESADKAELFPSSESSAHRAQSGAPPPPLRQASSHSPRSIRISRPGGPQAHLHLSIHSTTARHRLRTADTRRVEIKLTRSIISTRQIVFSLSWRSAVAIWRHAEIVIPSESCLQNNPLQALHA